MRYKARPLRAPRSSATDGEIAIIIRLRYRARETRPRVAMDVERGARKSSLLRKSDGAKSVTAFHPLLPYPYPAPIVRKRPPSSVRTCGIEWELNVTP